MRGSCIAIAIRLEFRHRISNHVSTVYISSMRRLIAIHFGVTATAFMLFVILRWWRHTSIEYYLGWPCLGLWMIAGLLAASVLIAGGVKRTSPGMFVIITALFSSFGAMIAVVWTLELLRLSDESVYSAFSGVPVATFIAPWIYMQARVNGRTYRVVDVLLTIVAVCIFVVITESFRGRMYGNFYGRLLQPGVVGAAIMTFVLATLAVWLLPIRLRFAALMLIATLMGVYQLFLYTPGFVS